MDFYLTSLQSGDRLRFPLLPDRLNVKTGAMVIALNIIKTGEVRIPRGSILTGYSWNGTLPGEAMQALPFVYDWQPPARIVELLSKWEAEGQTLRFMVTDLSVNVDVFIEAFTYDYYGIGNVSYTLNLTTRKELTVTTVPAPPPPPPKENDPDEGGSKTYGIVKVSSRLNVRQKASTSAKILGTLKNGTRVEILGSTGNWYIIPYASGTNGKAYVYKSYVKLETQSGGGSSGGGSSGGGSGSGGSSGSSGSGSYKVKSGDSLYSIAKAMLGDGNRWMEIYNLNKSAIDAANKGKAVSKYTLTTGMSLKLPAKKATTTKTTSTSTLASTVKSVVSKVTTAVKSVVTAKPSSTLVKAASAAVKTVTSVASKIASLFKK